jgi:hypothetical protein
MPENFDTMLAELADAVAEASTPPGLEQVRRRARQRELHRRMSVSVVALALIGAVGGGWIVAHHRYDPTDTVAPLSGQTSSSWSSTPRTGATPVPNGVRTAPSASSRAGAYAFTGGAEAVVWSVGGVISDNYLIVFSDGTVALSSAGYPALCYGRLGAAGTASTAAATSTSNSASITDAGLSAVPGQPIVDVACDNFGSTTGLTAQPLANGTVVALSVPGSTAAAGETFTQLSAFGKSGAPGSLPESMLLKLLAGVWISADGSEQTLIVGIDGSVSYRAFTGTATPYAESGRIDAKYSTGARAVLGCKSGVVSACQVLLIEGVSPSADDITVYGSNGPVPFVRKG